MPSRPRRPMRFLHPRGSGAALVVCGLLALHCGSRTEVDLLTLFPFTERGLEAAVIDLGSPEAEPHLVRGWSRAETLPTGETVAWGMAKRSTVRFAIQSPTDARLVLRCGVPSDGGRGPVPTIVSLNRRRIGSMRLKRTLEEHVVRLPAHVQRTGMNELALSNPFVSTAALRARHRARPMACDVIRIEGLDRDAPSRPAVVRDGGVPALALPAAARVDFHLRVPPRAVVVFGVEAARPDARLRVSLATDGSEARVLFDDGAFSGTKQVDLSSAAGRLARLSFEAGAERVLVRAPRLLGAPPPRRPPPRRRARRTTGQTSSSTSSTRCAQTISAATATIGRRRLVSTRSPPTVCSSRMPSRRPRGPRRPPRRSSRAAIPWDTGRSGSARGCGRTCRCSRRSCAQRGIVPPPSSPTGTSRGRSDSAAASRSMSTCRKTVTGRRSTSRWTSSTRPSSRGSSAPTAGRSSSTSTRRTRTRPTPRRSASGRASRTAAIRRRSPASPSRCAP